MQLNSNHVNPSTSSGSSPGVTFALASRLLRIPVAEYLENFQTLRIPIDANAAQRGDCKVRVDTGVLARREARLLRCAISGCRTSYEIPDAAPAPPKTSVQQFLDSLVPLAYVERVTEVSAVPRYICSRHPRVGSHCVVFDFLGRTEREFYSVKHGGIRSYAADRNIHFQDHLSRGRFRIDTSVELRHLVRPDAPPEFLPPTSEELIRLRAASEYYDRPSWCRPAWHCPKLQQVPVSRGGAWPREVYPYDSRPTAVQTKEWERKLRDSFAEDYRYAFRQADVVLYRYIRQLMHERDTASRERRIEIDQHVLHMLRTLPFHPAESRYPLKDPKLIRDEVTVARGLKIDADGSQEEVDVFEQVVPNWLPTRTKTKIRETLQRIAQAWVQDTKTRLARFNKLMSGDPDTAREAVRRVKDFKKLLGASLMLTEDMTAAQAELLTREPATAIEKRAQRLGSALHLEEMKRIE